MNRFLVLAALVLVACGPTEGTEGTGGGAGGGGGSSASTCSFVISGPRSATYDCKLAVVYATTDDISNFILSATSENALAFSLGFTRTGHLTTGTFGHQAPITNFSSGVFDNPNSMSWAQEFKSSGETGSFSLTINAPGTQDASAPTITGTHGTATATLPEVNGRGANVTISATF